MTAALVTAFIAVFLLIEWANYIFRLYEDDKARETDLLIRLSVTESNAIGPKGIAFLAALERSRNAK